MPNWQTGLLLIPGVFIGGFLGGHLARQQARRMRQVFAALLFLLGVSQVFSAWHHEHLLGTAWLIFTVTSSSDWMTAPKR